MSSLKPRCDSSLDRSSVYSVKAKYVRRAKRRPSPPEYDDSVHNKSVASIAAKEMSPQEHLEKIWSRELIERMRNPEGESERRNSSSVEQPAEAAVPIPIPIQKGILTGSSRV